MGWLAHLWHWIEIHTGTVNEPGPYYGFFSGFGSDIGEVTILGAAFGLYRAHNCHTKGCPFFARHTTPDGFRLCRRCIAKPRATLDLPDIHPDHR